MDSFEHLIKEKGTCCICTKPLKDSEYLNLAHLDKKAAWKFPVWNNIFIQGLEDRAVAIVCDGCQEAAEKSGVGGMIKYAIEVRAGSTMRKLKLPQVGGMINDAIEDQADELIMHDVDDLQDAEPIIEPENSPDIPDFFTGSVKDQRHGFFRGLN